MQKEQLNNDTCILKVRIVILTGSQFMQTLEGELGILLPFILD